MNKERKKELVIQGKRELQEYINELGDTQFGKRNMLEMYIQGADYADCHPRKGLVDIEKVIEYMKKNSRFNYLLETDWEVLEDLRKAMED
jgi:hypothetical protein